MTAAAVATLYIAQGYTQIAPKCVGNIDDPAIDGGLKYLGDHLTELGAERRWYTPFAVSRVGLASGHKYLGSTDWFRGPGRCCPRPTLHTPQSARRSRWTRSPLAVSTGPLPPMVRPGSAATPSAAERLQSTPPGDVSVGLVGQPIDGWPATSRQSPPGSSATYWRPPQSCRHVADLLRRSRPALGSASGTGGPHVAQWRRGERRKVRRPRKGDQLRCLTRTQGGKAGPDRTQPAIPRARRRRLRGSNDVHGYAAL